jgi:hypothetical protein
MEIAKVKAAAEQQKAQMDIVGKQVDLQSHVLKARTDAASALHQHALDREKLGMEAQQAQREHEMTLQQMEAKMRADAAKPEAKP